MSNSVFALQVSDPDTICETKNSTIAVSSYNHCKKGELIKVDAFDMQRVCELNSIIVPIQNEYLCVYRGSKRNLHNRPLNETEKLLKKENMKNLIDKYTN